MADNRDSKIILDTLTYPALRRVFVHAASPRVARADLARLDPAQHIRWLWREGVAGPSDVEAAVTILLQPFEPGA